MNGALLFSWLMITSMGGLMFHAILVTIFNIPDEQDGNALVLHTRDTEFDSQVRYQTFVRQCIFCLKPLKDDEAIFHLPCIRSRY